jgi:hypothetical protein
VEVWPRIAQTIPSTLLPFCVTPAVIDAGLGMLVSLGSPKSSYDLELRLAP